ncbi:MAG: polysaccharide deacetylase family protein [Clostridia bacterium]
MRVLFIGKKMILAVSLLIITCIGFFATPKVQQIVVSSTARDLPIYDVQTDNKVISLSFDAAWGNEDTQLLIDILAEYDVKATFFVVGEWVDKYPESVLALYEAGHEIQNHSDTHPHMTTLDYSSMVSEMNSCSDKIESITGVRPTLFRPPYGDYDDKLVATLREQGYYCIQWSIDSLAIEVKQV